MVGAMKTNRCGTCRKRKIKCDEVWPICGPCKQSSRHCPPRPSLKVIDDGLRVRRKLAKLSDRETPRNADLDRLMQTDGTPGSNDYDCFFQNEAGDNAFDLRLLAPMTLTPSEQLSYEFINCLSIQYPSYSLKIIGAFAWQIPERLGSSTALDDVAACMLASHAAIVRRSSPSLRINPVLYARALRSVQQAIDDQNEWKSSNTLCAVLLLHRIEAVFGESFGLSEVVHASGLAALLEKRGPPKPTNTFDSLVITDSHACIIHQALIQRKDCFIASEEWTTALDALHGRSHLQTIFYRLLRQMAIWPNIVREKLDFCEGNSGIDLIALVEKVHKVKTAMLEIGLKLDALINKHQLIRPVPPTCLLSLVPEMLEFQDPMAAVLWCYHAMYSIIISQILSSLINNPLYDSELKGETLHQSERIWMLVEHGRQNKPLGLPILQAALITTVEWADWEAQEEIIAIMNDLDSSMKSSRESWTREKMIYKAMVFRGDRAV